MSAVIARRAGFVAVTAVVMLAAPFARTPAYAATNQTEVDLGTVAFNTAHSPLFDLSDIMPGWTGSVTIPLRNDSGKAVSPTLSATDIVEFEHGCGPAEISVDSTCGPKDGELGHELRFSVYLPARRGGSFATTPAWTGTLYELGKPVSLGLSVPAHSSASLRVVAALPVTAGNEVQGDGLGFAFRLTACGHSTSLLGSIGGPDGHGNDKVRGWLAGLGLLFGCGALALRRGGR